MATHLPALRPTKSIFVIPAALLFLAAAWPLSANAQSNKSGKDLKSDSKPSGQKVIRVFNGKDLKALNVLKKSYFEDHGSVKVKDGILILEKGMPGTGIAIDPKVVKDLPRINYEVLIRAKRIQGDDFFCGLTFPVNKAYCTLILGGWGGGAIGLSNVDSMSAIENETSEFHEFENNKWYDIHLVVSEKNIRATLQGKGSKKKTLFEIETSEHKYDIWWEQEPARPFGLTTWNTSAAFEKIEIRLLPQKIKAKAKVK